jgi:hypothetical protein
MLQDVRFGIRTLLKNWGFTLVAMLSLAIGIGANSAIFSMADALLLRPLPVPRPGDIATVQTTTPSNPNGGLSYRDYVDLRDRNKSFDGLVGYSLTPFGFSPQPGALAQRKYGFLVTGNFFTALGVQPELGRGFRADEDRVPGRDAVVVLSHDLWEKQFGADRAAIGRNHPAERHRLHGGRRRPGKLHGHGSVLPAGAVRSGGNGAATVGRCG